MLAENGITNRVRKTKPVFIITEENMAGQPVMAAVPNKVAAKKPAVKVAKKATKKPVKKPVKAKKVKAK